MEIYDYTVEKEESGIRIDRYLAEKDSGLSQVFPSETSERRTDYRGREGCQI